MILVLSLGFSTFLVCLLVHVLVWRTRQPEKDIMMLFYIFVLVPLAVFSVVGMFYPVFSIALLHMALSSAYIQSYPPARSVSPSLKIMILVQKTMPYGMSKMDIKIAFSSDEIVDRRFKDLINSDLILDDKGFFFLTPSGLAFVNVLVFYRKLLGLEFDGG